MEAQKGSKVARKVGMVICILGLLFMLISCSACLRDPGDMPEASILGFFLAVIGGTMWILIKNDQGK